MNRLISARTLAAAALALGAIGVASAAHARSDVFLSIGVNAPFGYVQPAPVYVAPQPVYVQPRPVYVQPRPVYVQPQPVYVQPRPVYVQPQTIYYGNDRRWERRGPYGDSDRDGIANVYDRDSRFYDPRLARRHGAGRDLDRDGVPNRFDRAPHNPYRY
jgi:hypothetical protein